MRITVVVPVVGSMMEVTSLTTLAGKSLIFACPRMAFLPVWCVEDHGVVLYTMEDFDGAGRPVRA